MSARYIHKGEDWPPLSTGSQHPQNSRNAFVDMYGLRSEDLKNFRAGEEQRGLRSLVAAASRRELAHPSGVPRESLIDLERETEESQRDAAAVLAYVRNRQAERAHAGLTDDSSRTSSARAKAGGFGIVNRENIPLPGYGAERRIESVADSHAWIRRDSQLVRDERTASLLASSASAASAAKTLAEAIELQGEGEWYPKQGSMISSFSGSTPNGVASKPLAFLPFPSATSTPTTDTIRHISAVRQISALETEVSALELEIVHKKAMLDATISEIRGTEEEIQKAHLHTVSVSSSSLSAASFTIAGRRVIDHSTCDDDDVDNNTAARAAEARSRLATSSAIQQSLLGSLKTARAIHAVESALNGTHLTENGKPSGVYPSSDEGEGGQERGLGLAPSLSPPTSSLRLSSRLSPSYLEEMAALVERLEADAAVVSTVAREKAALEEQIMQNERTVQQKRKTICDYRVGIFTGLGPIGEGFCSAAAKREERENKGGTVERIGTISSLGGDLTQLVEKIAGGQHHNSSSALWRDLIRSLYASLGSTERNSSNSIDGDAELGEAHSSNSHSRHPNTGHSIRNNSRTAQSCVTLVFSDLSHLSETLDRAHVTGHFHLAERERGNQVDRDGGEQPQGYTSLVSLSVQQRMAYFNRKYVCDSWPSETGAERFFLPSRGDSAVGEEKESPAVRQQSSLLPSSSLPGDKGFLFASIGGTPQLRYETSACIPKLAEEALRPSFLANAKGTDSVAGKEGEADRTARATESAKEASSSSTLWGSISDVPPTAYGSCIILLPSGALGALSKRIKDLSPQSSLRTLAVANYGIQNSDVSVVNHANQPTGTTTGRQSGLMPPAHSPSPHSREGAGPFASEIIIRGLLQQQVLPFVASLISQQLLPVTYAADTRVLVPDFLTVLGAERKMSSTAVTPQPFHYGAFHEARSCVSASSFIKRFGNRFLRTNKNANTDSSRVSSVAQVADGNDSQSNGRIPLEESDPRHVDAVEVAVADLLLSLFGRS